MRNTLSRIVWCCVSRPLLFVVWSMTGFIALRIALKLLIVLDIESIVFPRIQRIMPEWHYTITMLFDGAMLLLAIHFLTRKKTNFAYAHFALAASYLLSFAYRMLSGWSCSFGDMLYTFGLGWICLANAILFLHYSAQDSVRRGNG